MAVLAACVVGGGCDDRRARPAAGATDAARAGGASDVVRQSAAFCRRRRGTCGDIELEYGDNAVGGTPIGTTARDRLIVARYDRLIRDARDAPHPRVVDMRRVARMRWIRMFVFDRGVSRAGVQAVIAADLGFRWPDAPRNGTFGCAHSCPLLLVFASRRRVLAAVSRHDFGALNCLSGRGWRPRRTRLRALRSAGYRPGDGLPGAPPTVVLAPAGKPVDIVWPCLKTYGVLR